jgi:hypothetical protein
MNKMILCGPFALILSTLACRPVLAISWNEFLIVSVLFAVLLGPSIYRWIRKVEQFLKHKKNNK